MIRVLCHVLAIAFLVTVWTACERKQEEPKPPEVTVAPAETPQLPVTEEEMKEDLQETMEAVSEYTEEQKGMLLARMEERLAEFNELTNDLKEFSESLEEETRQEFEEQLSQLQEKKEAAEGGLAQLREASEMTWADLKTAMDGAMTDLEESYAGILARFQEEQR